MAFAPASLRSGGERMFHKNQGFYMDYFIKLFLSGTAKGSIYALISLG